MTGAGEAAPVLEVFDLGRVPYDVALELQRARVLERARGAIPDQLLLLEHDSVVTIGRGADRSAAGSSIFPVVEVERGGEATWHGPGQLVGYPILALEVGRRDLHRYLRDLEETLIRALADLGVDARRDPPHTGVWIGAKKVASIGVAVRRWVTFHGFALNVDPDLAAFRGFAPCGLDASVMTSLAAERGGVVDRVSVAAAIVQRFAEVFGRRVVHRSEDRGSLGAHP